MGRSQRHMLWEQGATAAGEIHAQGVVAPGIAMQVDPASLNVLKAGPPLYNTGLELKSQPDMTSVEVPVGEPGGPLQGSTLTGAIPEGLAPPPEPEPGPEPGPDPEPGQEPSLNSINPSGAAINDPDLTMNVTGQRFTETSVIYFNGGAEETTFHDAGKLSTTIKPSTATTPGAYPVWVQQGSFQTQTVKNFTFVAENETWTEPLERSFPIGPVNLTNVADEPLGILLVPADAIDIHLGDTVLVEATGSTPINGSYTVVSVNPLVVDNMTELAAPIANKGRITVTAGAP